MKISEKAKQDKKLELVNNNKINILIVEDDDISFDHIGIILGLYLDNKESEKWKRCLRIFETAQRYSYGFYGC